MSAATAVDRAVARSGWRVGLAGGLAVLVSAVAIQPLLDGGWWLPGSMLLVLAIVSVGALIRGAGWPAPIQPVLQAVTLLVCVTQLFAREEARWSVLPGPAALSRLRELAASGRSFADASVPPAGFHAGLLLLVVAGVGLVALVVDTLTANLDLPGLSLIPLGALFVVPWIVGRGEAPAWTFALVAGSWLGLLAATQRERSRSWSPSARPGSGGVGVAVAGAATAVALLAGGLTGLRGPAGELPFMTRLSAGGTLTVDVMVSLRRSLVSNDNRVVMTMTTTPDRPDYLRLAVLDQFDGEQWSASSASTLGPKPPARPAGAGSAGSLQQYHIEVGPLTGTTLPSPTGTVQSLGDWPVKWAQETALPMRADGRTIQRSRVDLVVDPVLLDVDALRQASVSGWSSAEVGPEDIADPTPLVGPALAGMAAEVTTGARTPFDAALALQQWFTIGGGFSYSTDVPAGSDGSALDAFLTDREGYCEQFAATMALMARTLGIPARVVVGFTQGREEGNTWVVRGTDAHAWPELWMGSAGWLRFEPTPGAPTTTRPGYTQPRAAPYAGPSGTAANGSNDSAGQQGRRRPEAADQTATGELGGNSGDGLQTGLIAGVVLAGLAVALVPAVVRVGRRVRRRRRARSGVADAAYQEVCDTLVDLGLGVEAATPRATLASVRSIVTRAGADPEVERAAERLLAAVEWQRYAPVPGAGPAARRDGAVAVLERPGEGSVGRAASAVAMDARIVCRGLAGSVPWPRRVRALVLPRSVLSGWGRRLGGVE